MMHGLTNLKICFCMFYVCCWLFQVFFSSFLCFPYNERFDCSVSALVVNYGTELQYSVTTHIYFN